MPARIAAIYRYPTKGLSAERLAQVTLATGDGLPQDRRFALALADTPFDPAKPEWLSKDHFAMLRRDEKLAALKTRFDAETDKLTIEHQGQAVFAASITVAEGKKAAACFFDDFLGESVARPLRLVEAPGHHFFDARRKPNAATDKYVSLVNLASLAELAKIVGRDVDPLRFRANLYLDGLPAWHEMEWIDAAISVGNAMLRGVSPITRCAATHVNPATAARDLDVLGSLKRGFNHVFMGVYAEVTRAGDIAEGDTVAV
jgi:MOSC domain-containing protein